VKISVVLIAVAYGYTELLGSWGSANGPIVAETDYMVYLNTTDGGYPYISINLPSTGYLTPAPLTSVTVAAVASVSTLFSTSWSTAFDFSDGYPYILISLVDTSATTMTSVNSLLLVGSSVTEEAGATNAAYLGAGVVHVCVHQYSYADDSWFVSAIGVYDDDHEYLSLPSPGVFSLSYALASVEIPVEFGYSYAFGTTSIAFSWGDGSLTLSGTATSSNNTVTCTRSSSSDYDMTFASGDYDMASEYFYTLELATDETVDVTLTFDYSSIEDIDSDTLAVAYYDEDEMTWMVVDCDVDDEEMTLSCDSTHLSTWMIVNGTSADDSSDSSEDSSEDSSDDSSEDDSTSSGSAIKVVFALVIAAFSIFY